MERMLARSARGLDGRLRAAAPARRFLRKIFPDHWSFLLGEIALYSFIILLLTGVFLTLFFKPSMAQVTYDGMYPALHGTRMSEAYASTLRISFDVRGGLLIRQIHHWAALIFLAAIMVHLLRVFFTGAYRRPREVNWIIGVVLFTLAMVEGLFGYSLPDDLLSGTGLRITEGVAQSIPVVGSYLVYFLFGPDFPGDEVIPRLYIMHVLLIPGLLLALITAHLLIMFHQKHTQRPGPGRTEQNVVGQPLYPHFMAKTGAFFFAVFGVTALLATVAQINPVWLYGPYRPSAVSAGSQPDFYLGALEGALRIMPNWHWDVLGVTVPLNVLIPATVPLGLLLGGAANWPFLERWITGDRREHHLTQRPRDVPTRTGIGVAAITFYGVLWLAGANDLIAYHFGIDLYLTTWIARIAVLAGPVVAYWVTKRICLGLQRQDVAALEHGAETGVIRQLPDGGYEEWRAPVPASQRAAVEARRPLPLPAAPSRGPASPARTHLGRLRQALNRILTESVPLPPAQPDDHDGERDRELTSSRHHR